MAKRKKKYYRNRMKHLHWTRYLSRKYYVRFVKLIFFLFFYVSLSLFLGETNANLIRYESENRMKLDKISLILLFVNEIKRNRQINVAFFLYECLKSTMEARKNRLSTFFL